MYNIIFNFERTTYFFLTLFRLKKKMESVRYRWPIINRICLLSLLYFAGFFILDDSVRRKIVQKRPLSRTRAIIAFTTSVDVFTVKTNNSKSFVERF